MAFTGDISLLISPVSFQDYMVDKDTGAPLAGGIVTCYQDDNQSGFKNWFFQSGTVAPYTYELLANPLTLTAVGTIDDGSGNDVLPFFYPYDETVSNPINSPQAYYITVDSADGTRQFVRHNFPFDGSRSAPTVASPTFRNYIINNNFWRNQQIYGAGPTFAPTPITLTNQTNIVLAPSQHDGFQYPDFRFIKNATGAVDTATFVKFALGTNPFTSQLGEIAPEFYLNHICTGTGSETLKCYSFPISYHIKTLDAITVTITLQTQQGSVNPQNIIKLYFLQDWGTQASSPDPIFIGTITPGSTWAKAPFTVATPSCLGANLSPAGDDGLYLLICMPVGLAGECNVNFTLPSIYMGTDIATNDFTTYDQTDAIINSPRTGDYRTSLNSFAPFGWVPANDGSIGQNNSTATTRANVDTWPLYNLIWNSVSRLWAPLSTTSGGSAYLDFTNGITLSLTKNLGRVLQGLDAIFITPTAFTATVTPANFIVTGSPTSTVNVTNTFTAGTPFQVTVSGGGVLPTVTANPVGTGAPTFVASTTYYVSSAGLTGSTIQVASTLADAIAGTNSFSFSGDSTATCTIVNTVNTLTLGTSQSPVLKAGTAVVFTTTSALPGGLAIGTIYYVTTTSLTATTITVNNNITDAMAGYFLPILTAGSGTNTVNNALGSYNGASYTTDVPLHAHSQNDLTGAIGANINSGGAGDSAAATNSDPTFLTGIEKVSLIQPSSNVNVYIKL